ncbi:hypothetical protein AMTRI_Chr01g105200 [Amborella trichopoda]
MFFQKLLQRRRQSLIYLSNLKENSQHSKPPPGLGEAVAECRLYWQSPPLRALQSILYTNAEKMKSAHRKEKKTMDMVRSLIYIYIVDMNPTFHPSKQDTYP